MTEGALLRDDVGDAQALPDSLEDLESPVRPGIEQTPLRCLLDNLFGGTSFEDAAGQCAQALNALGIIGPPTIGDNVDFGAFCVGIPHALSHLQMGNNGAIGSLLTSFTSIHVCDVRELIVSCQAHLYNPCI